MTAHDDLDRQLNAFLRDGPEELPYESLDAVRDRTEQTGQRVVIGPWRLPEMNKLLTIGVAAAAVIVIGLFVGTQLLGEPGGGLGSDPPESLEPIATPEPTATPEPSASVAAAAPQLTATFTSTQHGFSISYPEDWSLDPATEPWTDATVPLDFGVDQLDFLYDAVQESDLFLTIASQSIGDSTPEEWVAAQMASEEGCGAATEPVTVDDAVGLIGQDCTIAVVTTAERGYWIQLYTGSGAPNFDDFAWFEGVLATVQLSPEDALDVGASPSP